VKERAFWYPRLFRRTLGSMPPPFDQMAQRNPLLGTLRADMQRQKQMEEYGHGFLHAVAAAAGYGYEPTRPDMDSIDAAIYSVGPDDTKRRPRVELQLKCTTQFPTVDLATDIRFRLSAKNYRDLRVPELLVPRILVVLLMPTQPDEWIESSAEQSCLQRRAMWCSLRGFPESDNSATVTILLPGGQQMTPDAVRSMMTRIDEGGLP
jgi:hypothetical protein